MWTRCRATAPITRCHFSVSILASGIRKDDLVRLSATPRSMAASRRTETERRRDGMNVVVVVVLARHRLMRRRLARAAEKLRQSNNENWYPHSSWSRCLRRRRLKLECYWYRCNSRKNNWFWRPLEKCAFLYDIVMYRSSSQRYRIVSSMLKCNRTQTSW